MSYPNVDRQSDTLINSISKQILIMVNKVKNLLGTNDCSLAKLRHEATNYDKLTKPEMLVEYKSQLTDYFRFGEEYVHTCIKTLINEKLGNHVIKLKATLEDRLNDELVLVQYQSYEDAKVQADLSLMRAEISSLDSLLKEIKAENVALALRVAELETLTNELLVGSAEDKSKIKSLEMSHKELELSNAKLSSDVSELWKFAEYSKGDIIAHKEVISDLNNIVGVQQVHISELTNTVGVQQVQIGEQQVQISELTNTVGVQQVQIGEQQVQISELTNTVGVQQVQIDKQQVHIGELNNLVEKLEYKVGEQHIVICEQQQELSEVKVKLTVADARINTLEATVEELALRTNSLDECVATAITNLKYIVKQLALMKGERLSVELREEIVNNTATVNSQLLATFTNLSYTQAPLKQLQEWFKVLSTFKDFLLYLAKNYGFKPVYQLQMVDSLIQEYHTRYAIKV